MGKNQWIKQNRLQKFRFWLSENFSHGPMHECSENSELFQGRMQGIVKSENEDYSRKGSKKVGQ